MKAIAIDTAVSKITIAAKNDDKTVTAVYDIGMKQSETLLPAIQYCMEKVNLTSKDLDYLAITQGPGSFTGLRLGYAAIKSLQMVANKPLFAFSTLQTYAYPYLTLPFNTISAIDAHKDKFYFTAFNNNETIFQEKDAEIEEIKNFIKNLKNENDILIISPDKDALKEVIESETNRKIYTINFENTVTESLFALAEQALKQGKTGLNDYDGPVYLRASEAEENLKA